MRLLIASLASIVAVSAFAHFSTVPAMPDSARIRSWWLERFDEKKDLAAKGGYDVVFLGDSITEGWETAGSNVWREVFCSDPYRALNCGFGGDRTELLLWRLDHGQLEGLNPKAFVLMIGTNNTGHRTPEAESPTDTVLGIQQAILRLLGKFPEAKIILHPIFPRGATPDDPNRIRNDLVNVAIRTFAVPPTGMKNVLWCDFNAKLLTGDGALEKSMAKDYLHLGESGYRIWAEALKPYLDYALGRRDKAPSPVAMPAKTAVKWNGPAAATPEISQYWLKTPKPEENRLLVKRLEAAANVSRYYDVIWIGDSITHGWEKAPKVFGEKFGAYSILNLGFGGDKTQNTLWNVLHGGILDGIQTRLITLMVGTNNTWSDSAEDIASGIAACVKAIREKQPQAKLLLMPLLPREVAHERGGRNFRRKSPLVDEIMPKQTKVNELIRPLADGKQVIWCDLTKNFTDADGLPDIRLLGDGTHPNFAGYEVWADAVLPVYREILGK